MSPQPASPVQCMQLSDVNWNFNRKISKRRRLSESGDNTDGVASWSKKCRVRSVRFSEVNEVHEIISLVNFTAEEKEALWYDELFFTNTKQLITDIVFLMSSGLLFTKGEKPGGSDEEDDYDEGECCTRGLECRTPDGSRRRFKNKSDAISAVLDEQYRQISEGVHDPNLLANIYVQCSAKCRKAALDIGLQDEKDVLS